MRPRIICHMVSSIDGRLLVSRWTPPATGAKHGSISLHYERIAKRHGADGFIVGRKTMAEFSVVTSLVAKTGEASQQRSAHAADRQGLSLSVVIDPEGKLHYAANVVDGGHVVAVLGESVTDEYLAELDAAGVSYLFAGPQGRDLHQAMNTLGDVFGVRNLLLEGGGLINGAFLKADLIDEISLLVYPGIDGLSGVSSIFEYVGAEGDRPAAGRALRHFATETLEGGMVWLRYQVEDAHVLGG